MAYGNDQFQDGDAYGTSFATGTDWFSQNSPGQVNKLPLTGANGQQIQSIIPDNFTGTVPSNASAPDAQGHQYIYDTPASGAAGGDSGYPGLSAADKASIDKMLSDAQSTDDPTYWYNLAVQHGGVANTGEDWLRGRINIGDGALAVRNGTTKPFQDTSATQTPLAAFGQMPKGPAASGEWKPGMPLPLTPDGVLQPWDIGFNYSDFQAPIVSYDADGTPHAGTPSATNADGKQNIEALDPGFDFRYQQGIDALQKSAAASGGLFSGGTLKSLMDFGQQDASNEYSNVYSRAKDEWSTAYQKAQQEYSNAYGIFTGNQNNVYNKLTSVSNSGQSAASSLGSLGSSASSQFGNIIGNANNSNANLITGQGNANAAGVVGAANANSSSLSDIANNALGYATLGRSSYYGG